MTGPGVRGNTIYHHEDLFAELRFYFPAEFSRSQGEAHLFGQHRGLAIFYQKDNKLVWIYPEGGLEDDIARGYYRARSDSDGKFGWIFAVEISDDGKYISYKVPRPFFTSLYEYSIEHGNSRLIDRDWKL
jgi:hypothetical protein